MANVSRDYYFFSGPDAKKQEKTSLNPDCNSGGAQNDPSSAQSGQDLGERQKQAEKMPTGRLSETITVLGIKISYAKAFGIAFLIIFLLLFFPGIGVSSSTVSSKAKTAGG